MNIIFLSYLNLQSQTHDLSVYIKSIHLSVCIKNFCVHLFLKKNIILWSESCNELIRFTLCNSLNISALWQHCSFTHWIPKQHIEVNLDLFIPFGLEENLRQAQSDGPVPSSVRALNLSHRVQWPRERLASSSTIFKTKDIHWERNKLQRCTCYIT